MICTAFVTFSGTATFISRCRSRLHNEARRERRFAYLHIAKKPLLSASLPPESPAESNNPETNSVPRQPNDFYHRLNESTRKSARSIDVSAHAVTKSSEDAAEVTPLASAADETSETQAIPNGLRKASRALWRIGWLTWWTQLTLTVVSAVILLFALLSSVNGQSTASLIGLGLSGLGTIIAFISLFWTYGYTRLSIWLRKYQSPEKARTRISGKLRFGLAISLTGMVVLVLGLQAIVGTLLTRSLGSGIARRTSQSLVEAGINVIPTALQPVDILVVQACANAMTGLLSGLLATFWLRSREKNWGESSS